MNSPPITQPYKGLRPYEEQDRDNFFGREAECRILIDKILANKLTLLFAASGVGKNSLLQAAVLPRLKDPRYENRDAVYYNDWVSPPRDGLKEHVLKVLQQQGILENVALPDDLHAQSLKDFLGFCALFTRQPLVVVLDQVEEFFQYQRYAAEFKPFIQELAVAITDRDTPIAVVISMREDFALELNAFKPALPLLLFENFYRLERFDRANAQQAIEEPVQRVGFRYEPELLQALLKDLAAREQREHTAIPVAEWLDTVEPAYLQIACSQLWEFEKKDNTDRLLRLQTYRDKGSAAGILKNYVDSIIVGFTPGDKKLASKAFDHLITRRGTKMAYTAGDLAQLLGVTTEALGKVLDRLEVSRILRRQSRQGVFWYEMYHDLFSKPIEEWNEVYKAKQRNKRAFILAGIVVIAGLALYGAYDIAINYTSFHLRLSAKRGVSDAVELYQGKDSSFDILDQQKYLAETGYLRSQVEPDKLFNKKAVGDFGELNWELIGNLPLVERMVAYWQDGQTERALDLAKKSISEDDIQRSQTIIEKLADFYSPLAVQVLVEKLEQGRNNVLKENIIATLGTVDAWGTRDSWLKFKDDPNLKSRLAVVNVLGQLGDARAVEPLLLRLADADRAVRRAAAGALGQLGDVRAVQPLLLHLADPDPAVRQAAAEALGRLGDARAVEPLLPRLTDSKPAVRQAAAEALGQLGDARAVEPLLKRLKDTDVTFSWKDEGTVQQEALLALGKVGDAHILDAVAAVLQKPTEKRTFRLAAAVVLLKFNRDDGSPLLKDLAGSKNSDDRKQAAEVLGAFPTQAGNALLIALLKDRNLAVKQRAIQSLGQIQAANALPELHTFLKDSNINTQLAAAEALSQIASTDSTSVLSETVFNTQTAIPIRLATLSALKNIGTEDAIQIILEVVKKDEQTLGLQAYKLLGELGEKSRKQALPLLSDRLAQLEKQYHDWRQIRDAERSDFSKEESDKWTEKLKKAEPQSYWAFPLAQAIARIDPNGKGFELLSHDLADVRAGAWTGLSQVGDVKLLKRLHAERQDSKEPLFRHAAYRAIDLLLLRLGGITNLQDLTDLQDFYEQVKKEEQVEKEKGVGTRVEWTIKQLKEHKQ